MLVSRKNRILVFALGVGLIGLVAAALWQRSPQPAEERPEVGFLAPDFAVVDLDSGKTFRLSDLRGQPVLLNFWATWCPPCRQEMPDLDRTAREYAGKARVLAVGADPGETADTFRRFRQQLGLTLPLAVDSSGQAARLYRVRAIPTSFFIDPRGVIRSQRVGALTYEVIQQELRGASR